MNTAAMFNAFKRLLEPIYTPWLAMGIWPAREGVYEVKIVGCACRMFSYYRSSDRKWFMARTSVLSAARECTAPITDAAYMWRGLTAEGHTILREAVRSLT